MTDYIDSDLTSAYAHFQAAAAGDHILLTNGTYNNPSRKSLTKTTGSTVTFAAQNTGGVSITGQPIDITDNNTIFQGFDLAYNIASGDYVTISGDDCHYSRNKIHFANIGSPGTMKWVRATGDRCTFDHNELYDKTTIDDMFLAQGGTGHKCLYNYFHNFIQNPSDTKSEVIRYGNSNLAYDDFDGEVAYNRIETIDADVEVISIKCTNVNVHHNTLINTLGCIVLRQAYNCKVNNNILINSGMRIYGSGHEVTKNQVIDNTGTGSTRSLILGTGDVEELPVATLNANYARTKNCTISNNIFANGNSSTTSILALGDSTTRTFQPTGNTITNNIIQASTGTLADAVSTASWTANTVTGNILYPTGTAVVGDMTAGGYTNTNPQLKRLADGSYRCAYYVDIAEVGPLSP
jgi:hypothetical protein